MYSFHFLMLSDFLYNFDVNPTDVTPENFPQNEYIFCI